MRRKKVSLPVVNWQNMCVKPSLMLELLEKLTHEWRRKGYNDRVLLLPFVIFLNITDAELSRGINSKGQKSWIPTRCAFSSLPGYGDPNSSLRFK